MASPPTSRMRPPPVPGTAGAHRNPTPDGLGSPKPVPPVPGLEMGLKRVVSFNDVSAFQEKTEFGKESDTETNDDEAVATRRLAVVLVGLPARGKSSIARSLSRYLNWLGFRCSIFNVGEKRRATLGVSQPASFFDPSNDHDASTRWRLAQDALQEMITFLVENENNGGQVGFYDATNATRERRKIIRTTLENKGIRVLFLESICNDQSIIDRNIMKTKAFSPDYVDADPEYAIQDFRKRIAFYESTYETLDDSEKCSYLKTIDVGRQLVINQIQGYLPSKIVGHLLNSHIESRSIYMCRHGESQANVEGRLGGDPLLSGRGEEFARNLGTFVLDEFTLRGREMPLLWTSQMRRTRQTGSMVGCPTKTCWRALNEINAGICENMTYAEVKEKMPDIHEARKLDKLRFRYPQGESYVDLIHRLEPVILEIERQKGPILIVAHQAIIRCIYTYLMGLNQEEAPHINIPLHTVFKLTTRPYGCELVTQELGEGH